MKVRWTYEALKDLDEIEEYIALDDSGRAYDFINELIDLGESLEFDWKRGTMAKWTNDEISFARQFKSRLSLFKALSSREGSGCRLVSAISDRFCSWVPDPTLLIERDDYLNLVKLLLKAEEKFRINLEEKYLVYVIKN